MPTACHRRCRPKILYKNSQLLRFWCCRYTAFCNSLQAGTLEDAQKLLDELLKELYSIQLHIDRLQASAGAYEREQIYYSEQQQKLNAAIEQVIQLKSRVFVGCVV